jgi:uncharacterized protein (TIGR02996 family)
MDEDAFLRAIIAAPLDALPRLVFADWLGEHSRFAEEAGQRWAANNGPKRPLKPGPFQTKSGQMVEAIGGWYRGDDMAFAWTPEHCHLPDVFWKVGTYNIYRFSHSTPPANWPTLPESWLGWEREFMASCKNIVWKDGRPVRRKTRIPGDLPDSLQAWHSAAGTLGEDDQE